MADWLIEWLISAAVSRMISCPQQWLDDDEVWPRTILEKAWEAVKHLPGALLLLQP